MAAKPYEETGKIGSAGGETAYVMAYGNGEDNVLQVQKNKNSDSIFVRGSAKLGSAVGGVVFAVTDWIGSWF